MEKTLRIIRIIVEFLCFSILTAGLISTALLVPYVGRWLEQLQMIEVIIGMNLTIFVGWVLLTLLFGRIYCSTVCPMGGLIDIAARAPRLTKKDRAKRHYNTTEPVNWLRYGCMALLIVCLIGGWILIPSVIDPYSAYNRICYAFFRPILEFVYGHLSASCIVSTPAAVYLTSSVVSSIIATMLFAVCVIISAFSGRTLCNNVCPVGAMLGLVSRYSVFQMNIDTDLCTNCGRCRDACKTGCIDLRDHTVDGSRCVVCFDCAAVCPDKAIRYTTNRKRLSIPMMQAIGPQGKKTETASMAEPEATSENLNKPSEK